MMRSKASSFYKKGLNLNIQVKEALSFKLFEPSSQGKRLCHSLFLLSLDIIILLGTFVTFIIR